LALPSLPSHIRAESLPNTFLPFALPDISEREIQAVERVLRSGWITTGPEVKAFEQEFANAIGVAEAVAVNSCTAALHLGLEALGVMGGDEVLVPTVTFTATAEVVEYLGARSRFVDVDSDTLNLSPSVIRAVIERQYRRQNNRWVHRESGGALRAIVPVHFAGHMCDMEAFVELGRDLGISILDDAAHSLPASIGGRGVGTFGCPTAFSFYATKTITTGEGGMLTTEDASVAARVRLMALHGISRDAWKRYSAEGSWYYEVIEAGYKYNLTDIAAALGRVQLARAESMLARRGDIARRYHEVLGGVAELELPVVRPGVRHAWHLFPIRLRLDRLRVDRAAFIDRLKALGIGSSVHFIPLHRQPFYRDRYGYESSDFPVAEAEYPRLLSLPIYSRMTGAEVETVLAAVLEVLDEVRL
jgi:perosamine synthetase